MNIFNRNLLDYLLVFIIASFLFWPLPPPTEEVGQSRDKLAEKSVPNDLLLLQHSFPDTTPDIKAYANALKNATLQMKARSASLPGFDHPWILRGPGDAGARVNSIAAHPTDPNIIIAGYSGGGIFKTTDGGQNWYPVFDNQPYLAIGDIVFDPTNPAVVYAGTGDPNITNHPFIGDGIFKSTDLGETWTNIGLQDKGIISRIEVDPTNSNIIYVGTMGIPFARGTARGLYKTTDGGATWSQILFVSDTAGIIDLLLNPDDPDVIYAASWDRIRNNSESIIAGVGAKIHKSIDGGQNWTVLTGGLPDTPMSRIGLAMSGNNSDHIFALYIGLDLEIHNLYKSVDAGQNWSTLSTGTASGLSATAMGSAGWYFGKLRVDPTNDNLVYILGVQLWASNSGGNSWYMLSQIGSLIPHVDHHDLTFDANGNILIGTDGGMYRMIDGTNTWEDIENIPTTQFYRTAYNPHEPDQFYGGTQDNGTQSGTRGEMVDWADIGFGDGFQPVFHPNNPDTFYIESQNGVIYRTENGGNSFLIITDFLGPGEPRAWDMQYIMSPHNPDILYAGTDRLHIGYPNSFPVPWTPISGVLSEPTAQSNPRFHLISTLSESPVDSALIYVGTSDAKVHRRNPDTDTWTDISAGLPGRYVTDVVASPDEGNVVFVAHSGYRDGEYIPHVHRSDDRGDNWIDISGDLPQLAVNDLFVMPNNFSQVIFAATDGGLYASLDGGNDWERLGTDMPIVPVYDIAYNEHYNEIIAATFARSIYTFPLDSIGVSNSPLQVSIAGTIMTESGDPINAVNISGGQATTQSDGTYLLNAIGGNNCAVDPSKNTNIRNGVSISDLVSMQRDLLFIDALDSPYKIIAADVNNNGSFNITDLVVLQRIMLFIDNEFPNNESWRFIDAGHVFSDPTDPLSENFEEAYDCSGASGSIGGIDFVGVKVGDVTGDAGVNFHNGDPISEEEELLTVSYEDRILEKGEEAAVVLRIRVEEELLGFQAGVDIDEAALEMINLEAYSTNISLKEKLQQGKNPEGDYLFLWSDYESELPQGEYEFVKMELKAKVKTKLSSVLKFSEDFRQEAVFERGGAMVATGIRMESFLQNTTAFDSPEIEVVASIYPNPIHRNQRLYIDLKSREMQGYFTILQADGQEVFKKKLTKDQTLYEIDPQVFPGRGLYFIQLDTDQGQHLFPLVSQ